MCELILHLHCLVLSGKQSNVGGAVTLTQNQICQKEPWGVFSPTGAVPMSVRFAIFSETYPIFLSRRNFVTFTLEVQSQEAHVSLGLCLEPEYSATRWQQFHSHIHEVPQVGL